MWWNKYRGKREGCPAEAICAFEYEGRLYKTKDHVELSKIESRLDEIVSNLRYGREYNDKDIPLSQIIHKYSSNIDISDLIYKVKDNPSLAEELCYLFSEYHRLKDKINE